MVQFFLIFLMALSLALRPYRIQQVQPAYAQTSGEVLLQNPLWHLLYVRALIHPRFLDVPCLIGAPLVQLRL